MIIHTPIASQSPDGQLRSHTLSGLANTIVGFIDNGKPNFNYLVDDLSDFLISRHGVKQVIKRRKPGQGTPASPAVMKELTEQCNAVITGSGD